MISPFLSSLGKRQLSPTTQLGRCWSLDFIPGQTRVKQGLWGWTWQECLSSPYPLAGVDPGSLIRQGLEMQGEAWGQVMLTSVQWLWFCLALALWLFVCVCLCVCVGVWELTRSVPVWFTVLSAPLPALMTLRENINLTHSAGISTGVVYNSDTAGSTAALSFKHTEASFKRSTDAPWCRHFQQFNLHSAHNNLVQHEVMSGDV